MANHRRHAHNARTGRQLTPLTSRHGTPTAQTPDIDAARYTIPATTRSPRRPLACRFTGLPNTYVSAGFENTAGTGVRAGQHRCCGLCGVCGVILGPTRIARVARVGHARLAARGDHVGPAAVRMRGMGEDKAWDPILIASRGTPDAVDRSAVRNVVETKDVVYADYPARRTHPYEKPPEVPAAPGPRLLRRAAVGCPAWDGHSGTREPAFRVGHVVHSRPEPLNTERWRP